MDTVHEADGGDDTFGPWPQLEVELFPEELDLIVKKGGLGTAWGEVSGRELGPEDAGGGAPAWSNAWWTHQVMGRAARGDCSACLT